MASTNSFAVTNSMNLLIVLWERPSAIYFLSLPFLFNSLKFCSSYWWKYSNNTTLFPVKFSSWSFALPELPSQNIILSILLRECSISIAHNHNPPSSELGVSIIEIASYLRNTFCCCCLGAATSVSASSWIDASSSLRCDSSYLDSHLLASIPLGGSLGSLIYLC
ncbi:hypothetical protein Tco_0652458 [Tanacetum coccineum]|uniref:Cytochrome c biogenesis B n=1 Tax=Tanacetum coccineum TaxID=301880 RepID=A0ABQ4WXP8_9ASTR